jgi:hypothetical protein
MKKTLLLVVACLVFATSCTYRTCPTYMKSPRETRPGHLQSEVKA